ncbi:TPA: hypothetical protein DDZ75_01545 [Patescibacteria group bacterium]|nr:hypothetical protein [Patescibacteria group bacterium]
MNKLHNKTINDNIFVPKEGQRDLLCSNKKSLRCPSLGIKNPNDVLEDVALDYFAGILVEAFINKKEYEYNQLHKSKTSSDICPSIHKRTSGRGK